MSHPLPPSRYTHHRYHYPFPKKNPSHTKYTRAAFTLLLYTILQQSCSCCSLTLSQTFANTKTASNTGVAQIFIFIIYKMFHIIFFFNVVFRILANQKYFGGYLQCLDMVCLSIQKQKKKSHFTDFHNSRL